MTNLVNRLHSSGYVILPQKISVPTPVIDDCRLLFAHKKVKYTFNGISPNANDKKRYMSNIDDTSHIQKWMKKTHDILAKHKLITNNLFYNSSIAFASAAGCMEQPPHCDYPKSPEFACLTDRRVKLQHDMIKRGDYVLYVKDANRIRVTINQIHLDDYPNYYYTIQLPDGTEKQTTFNYLEALPEPEHECNSRREKIPLIVLTAIMDNTKIDVWENSINWMQMNENDTFDPRIRKNTITLQTGQICVLRGDVIHAGSAYADENIRIYSFYNNYTILPDKNKVHVFGDQTVWEKEITRD